VAAKKIGILGTGSVGNALATGFRNAKYEVQQGGRNDFDKISAWADLIVLAVKGTAAESAIGMIRSESLKGKTIIDTCNPIADAPPEDGVLQFFTQRNQSLLEILQTKVPSANFVKAFSCVGAGFMVAPSFPGGKPTMFICGNQEAAKGQVREILGKFGWETEDMGTAKAARAIEPLCQLWCIPGLKDNKWTHAFKLLKM
jgi:8-hydroxy-5-deazaflavin:NADPH oxidoreductase